jgi:hypothetical protein
MSDVLRMQCKLCKISSNCKKNGSSPLYTENGRKIFTCQMIGGYSLTPVDKAILSQESLEEMEKHGPCLTIAEVPVLDQNSGHVVFELTKIFHEPILHPRTKTDYKPDSMLSTSYKLT